MNSRVRRLHKFLFSAVTAVALGFLPLQAAEPHATDTKPDLTTEQLSALDALKGELARLDPMLEKVGEPEHQAWVKAKVEKLKERFRDLPRNAFDQTKFDELRFDVNIEYQRLAMWLRPPLAPPKAK